MKKFSMPPEMKVASVWVVWAFLAIGALGWALFVLLNVFDAKKDAAAWVQAVGSIAAIIGAFMVAQRTHQLERQLRAEEALQAEVDALYFAEHAAYEAYSAVHHVTEYATSAPYMIGLARLEEVRYTLRNLLKKSLPVEVCSSIFVVQEQVSEALSVASRVKGSYEKNGYEVHRDADELKRRREAIWGARKTIAGLYWHKAEVAEIDVYRRPEDDQQREVDLHEDP
ncbi:hypothetical protein HBO40_00225 [Pseudomonas protegens]|uniref:hypothetical protein n=1 Tax=Pseudomonas protegens TaxID=380021 RepID=UPI001475D401|nr:hypothetical protein [Pseudomonas protegens]NMZ26026.1 hypothetical protein [Pseudomonas protegens]NMZ84653.1 hypothetical protein [Pseudomonas protegens]